MNFLKNWFGFGSAEEPKKDEEKREESQGDTTNQEEHNREHQGEAKKPKNVCEFC